MNLLDLKLAVRNLIKNRAFTIINILGLTVGLTACLYIALLLRHETSYDNFHPDANRTYRILVNYTTPDRNISMGYCDALAGVEILDAIPGIESGCRVSSEYTVKLIRDDQVFKNDKMRYVDPGFFSFFGFKLERGNPGSVLVAPNQIVITEKFAREAFGDEDPVGKVLRTSEDVDWVVSGICSDPPSNSHLDYEILVSVKTAEADPNLHLIWDGGMKFLTYIKLGENTSPETINALFPDFLYPRINKKYESAGWKLEYRLQPIADIHLGIKLNYDEASNRTLSYLAVISSVALLILFLAIINYINLASAMARLRFKEIGIRKILGANRKSIRNQMLAESVILALIAGLFAAILLHFIYPVLNRLTGTGLNPYSEPLVYFLALILIPLFTGIVTGIAPALLMAGRNAAQSLQERIRGRSKAIGRNILVSLQFSIAVFLIICFIIIQKQSGFVTKTDLGFQTKSILSLPNDKGYTFEEADRLKQELEKLPEIESVCLSSQLPGQEPTANGYIIEGKNDPEIINVIYVDNEFLECFGIEMIEGRNFRADLEAESKNFLVNEALVEHAGWNDPIGKVIRRNFDREVIGVYKNFHFKSLHEPISPLILSVQPRVDGWYFYQLNMRYNADNTKDLLGKIRSVWDAQMPGVIFDPVFLDDYVRENYGALANQSTLISMFSGIAILIACIGLFGMSAFVAFTRRKEIGIRKVNGALVSDIVLKLNTDMLKWIFVSFVIAIPLSFPAINKWLMNFAYKTNISWWIFPLAAGLALGIALLTVSWQSFRAARLDPVRTLRYE